MKKFGIDLSKWQKGFNFEKALAEGVEFIILRGAYSTSKDTCFEDFYKKCKAKGIPVGVYHYTMAKTVDEAKKEADAMLKILAGKQFEYPIYLDVEDKTQKALGKDLLTAIIDTYCSTLENEELEISAEFNTEAVSFQFDFLNEHIAGRDCLSGVYDDKLPKGLKDALLENKPIVFFINPPYGAPGRNDDETIKTFGGITSGACDTVINS